MVTLQMNEERNEYPISNKECPISKGETICRSDCLSFLLGNSLLDIGHSVLFQDLLPRSLQVILCLQLARGPRELR